MKISASIYSNKEKELIGLLRELDAYRIDSFHIDCNDDPLVFKDIDVIRAHSDTPVDLHLITEQPEKYYDQILAYDVDYVTFQYEPLKQQLDIPDEIKHKAGLAITSNTNIAVFEKYRNQLNHVLFMTTTPGQSGGVFNKENFRKIRAFKNVFPGVEMHVDGGINEEISFILRNMGVSLAVIGSYLFKNKFLGSAVIRLKSDDIESHYAAKDFMLEGDEVPLLVEGKYDFEQLLKTIEYYKMGLAIITNEQGRLAGLVTNADIRRALLDNIADLNHIDPRAIINKSPLYVEENQNVTDILHYIKEQTMPVQFLPVVNQEKIVTGTLRFNNLIKGEL